MKYTPKKIDVGPAELDWLASALANSGPAEEQALLKKIVSGLTSVELLEYPAGAAILAEGDIGKDFFVIYSGRLSVSKTIEAEPEELNVLEKGDFFGEMSFLLSSPRSATVRTRETSRVFRLAAPELAALVGAHSALELRLKSVAMERLSKTFKDV